jgi:hypothetical protein
MNRVDSNYAETAAKFDRWAAALTSGVTSAIRDITLGSEREAVKRLTGGSRPAGSYPVPNRTGFLRRSMGSRVRPEEGILFNSAIYARAVHDGYTPYSNPRVQFNIGARPYMTDAVAAVDPETVVERAIEEALPQ